MDAEPPIVATLGRFGDILNSLPIAYELHRQGRTPKFVVSSEFASILDGVSYVIPRVWTVDYKEIDRVIQKAKGKEAYICQCYKHPDCRRLTDSYQKESWRVAGWLDRFGTIPLVLDKRVALDEQCATLKYCLLTPDYHVQKKTILVADKSVSSPFNHDLVGILRKAFKDCNVIDLCQTKVKHPYDILGLMDNDAACLVTVDSFQMHLARASKAPMIAFINNGWFGSCLPSGGPTKMVRYSDFDQSALIEDVKVLLKC